MASINGQLENAVASVRTTINDAQITAKYSPATIVRQLGVSWDQVIQDLNTALGRNPIYATYDIEFNTTDREYLIPAGVGGLCQIGLLDSATGVVRAVFPCFGLNEIGGTNWVLSPPYLRFEQPFAMATTARLTFTPRGVNYMHAGLVKVPVAAGATTFTIDNSPFLGLFDTRLNAFIGGMVSVYAANVPAGYTFFPQQERRITAYNAATGVATVQKGWDTAITSTGDKAKYEILPMIDPALMALAELLTSRHFCALEQRASRVRAIQTEYGFQLATARRQYERLNGVREPGTPNKLLEITAARRPMFGRVNTGSVIRP